MTQAKDTDPTPTPPKKGPQLIIEALPFESGDGKRYKWKLEEDGRLLVMGMGDFATNWDAAQDAAKTSLGILHNLSMSYCRLAEEVTKVQEQARERFEEARAKAGESGGTFQKFASAHAPKEEESEEELSERARLDAESEAPDDEGEVD